MGRGKSQNEDKRHMGGEKKRSLEKDSERERGR